MAESVRISVIIPVHNGDRYLRATLESVLAQHQPAMEVLVVDDGSTDDSRLLAESFGGRVTLLAQPNAGVAAARNRGLLHAQGDYIAFIDQDDLWEADKNSTQLAALSTQPALDYVISRQRFFLEPGTPQPSWLKPELLEKDHAGYVMGAMLARRRAFDAAGLLDARYRYADDVSWFFHAKDIGMPMAHLPATHLHRRVHGGNASQHVCTIHRELLAVAKDSIKRRRAGGGSA